MHQGTQRIVSRAGAWLNSRRRTPSPGGRRASSLPIMGLVGAMGLMAAFSAYATIDAQRGHRVETELRLQELSRTVASVIGAEFQSLIEAAQLLAASQAFDSFPDLSAEASNSLSRRIQDFSRVMGSELFSVWRIDGPVPVRVLSGRAPFRMLNERASVAENAAALDQAVRTRRVAVSALFRYASDLGVNIAFPVQRDDKVVGLITVGVRTQQLQRALASQRLSPGIIAGVTDPRGQVVARVPERHIGDRASEEYRRIAAASDRAVHRMRSLDGTAVLTATAPLPGAAGFTLAIAMPAALVDGEQIAPLLAAGGLFVLAIGGLALLVTGGAWRRGSIRLREQDAYLAIAIDDIGLATWEADVASGRAVWSPRLFEMLGYPRDPGGAASVEMWLAAIHPEDRPLVREQRQRAMTDPDGMLRVSYRVVRRGDGALRWCETIARWVAGRMIGVTLDVTDAKREEAEKLLLAQEVDHRAKNLLAVVQGMVELTRAPDAETLRRSLIGRILALSNAHSLLAANHWSGAEVRQVVEGEIRSRAEQFRLDGGSLLLRPAAVQPLAILVHELATNAAKYGALSAAAGRVDIRWKAEASEFVLDWIERAGPPVEAPQRLGFGSRVTRRTAAQLRGTIRWSWPADGVRVEIRLPLAEIAATPTHEEPP